MGSYVEYRAGWVSAVSLVVPSAFFLGLLVYIEIQTPIHGLPALAGIGTAACLLLAMFVYGVWIQLVSSLKFYSEGFSFQDIRTPVLRFDWDDIASITIQDTTDSSGESINISYRLAIKLKDPTAYLHSIPETTRKFIERDSGYLGDGVVISTRNIRISSADLRDEITSRTSVPLKLLGNLQGVYASTASSIQTVAATPVDPISPTNVSPPPNIASKVQTSLADTTTVSYRSRWANFVALSLLSATCFGGGVWWFLYDQEKGGPALLMVIGLLIFIPACGIAATVKLQFEPEGLVYQTMMCPETRIRWEEVSGIHIASTRGGSNAGTVVVIELKDFNRFLSSVSPAQKKAIAATSRLYGDGVAIMTDYFPVKATQVASMILHRAGLPMP